ncbi:MAG: radical SAM protein [Desulfovibrio sp.]|nr:radical SAM protein [Desulfovibrio sp.]MBI4961158.1 radical SAM protein [Desulfovibrio sp.]
MKTFKGTPRRIPRRIVGVVTRSPLPLLKRPSRILVSDDGHGFGYSGIVSTKGSLASLLSPSVCDLPYEDACYLNDGDIVSLDEEGNVSVLWEYNSSSNSLLVTEKCNCNCVMCPQPPKPDSALLDFINEAVINLLPLNYDKPVCLTGGEPTINKARFLGYLKAIKTKLPNVCLDVLTNGQTFSDFEFVQEIFDCAPKKTTFCISLHGDTSSTHNSITNTHDGFAKTIYGIQNLARVGLHIEIRFVITQSNFSRMFRLLILFRKISPLLYTLHIWVLRLLGLHRIILIQFGLIPLNIRMNY